MGIWAILSGEFGDLQARVLGTTLTVVGTSILGLACGAFFESPRSRENAALYAVPIAGLILTVSAAAITLWLIWGFKVSNEEAIYKTLFVFTMFAFSLAQLSLLSLARLAGRFRWARVTTYAVVLVLASIVSVIVVFEPESSDETVLRLIGVLAVVDAALTVMIPIFHRLSRTEFANAEMPSAAGIEVEIDNLKAQIARLERQKEDILRTSEK